MSRRRTGLTAALAAVVVLVSGCSLVADTDPEAETGPSVWSPQDCPPDVEVLVVPEHSCGWVDAPLGEGRQQVFVVVVEPPTAPTRAPVLETGTDLGMTPAYAGLAPIAQRTGRRTVIVDLPGTGHSVPSLDCPAAEAIGDVPGDDPALLDAVGECRDALVARGHDPDLFSPRRSAEALLAVMDAIDEGSWVLMGHGTTGTAAVEVALRQPERVEALVLDSALQAHAGWPARRAALVAGVADACRVDARCHRRYGDVRASWRAAWLRARTDPVDLGPVDLDRQHLDRAVRWLVAPVTSGPVRLPALLAEASAGRRGPVLRQYAAALEVAPPLCVGLLPKCYDREQVVLGAVLSSVCPGAAGTATYGPACRRWGVPVERAAPAAVLEVPALVLHGRFDPYAGPGEARAAIAPWAPAAHVVVDPRAGHNVLGDECVRSVRTAWLNGATDRPPEVPACLQRGLDFP